MKLSGLRTPGFAIDYRGTQTTLPGEYYFSDCKMTGNRRRLKLSATPIDVPHAVKRPYPRASEAFIVVWSIIVP